MIPNSKQLISTKTFSCFVEINGFVFWPFFGWFLRYRSEKLKKIAAGNESKSFYGCHFVTSNLIHIYIWLEVLKWHPQKGLIK